MAHIANCIADIDASHISRPDSPQLSNGLKPPPTPAEKQFTWRMQQPDTQRKYQLFPRERHLPVLNSGKALDPEKAFAVAMSKSNEKPEKQSAAAGLRIRINQHSLIRRRKVSVPEMGLVSTTHDARLDSPTIPGRPSQHERSISAPGDSVRKHQLADTFLCTSPSDDGHNPDILSAVEEALQNNTTKNLTPLVIPQSNSPPPKLRSKKSFNHCRSGSESLRTGRIDESSRSRTPIFTPSTSASETTTPMSASTTATSFLTTPSSAPVIDSRTTSPNPWDNRSVTPLSADAIVPSRGHRRGASESSTSSIMDRGRPRKRSDVRNNNGPLLKRAESKRSRSTERRAFEQLPKGSRLAEASTKMELSELEKLHKQAFGQVERFEVLKAEDVESLSKELRRLDERTEYLRRTYNSLRAGRRNLHSRICQYLRSPRVAKFGHDSMLKQEEALAELDASIDDWVNKLEQAENRRTRVRQKLLEHVAAAACLVLPNSGSSAIEALQQTMAVAPSGVGSISTPPRSPTKQASPSLRSGAGSPSPQRVVAHVPSTILEDPIIEEPLSLVKDEQESTTALKREDVESIRIYAGDDVYALLADVENEITKMSSGSQEPVFAEDLPETARTQLHRQRSHGMLNGLKVAAAPTKEAGVVEPLAAAPTPPLKDDKLADGLILLTNAVFKPGK